MITGQENYRVGFKLLIALLVATFIVIASTLPFWRADLASVIILCVVLSLVDVVVISLSFATDDRESIT